MIIIPVFVVVLLHSLATSAAKFVLAQSWAEKNPSFPRCYTIVNHAKGAVVIPK